MSGHQKPYPTVTVAEHNLAEARRYTSQLRELHKQILAVADRLDGELRVMAIDEGGGQ